MPNEAEVSTLWAQFSKQLSDMWLPHGFNRIHTRTGLGLVRNLSETIQLVEYDTELRVQDQAIFTIQMAVWSRGLLKSRVRVPSKPTAPGHWQDNLINLMPPESGHLWWTVLAENFDADVSLHTELAQSTILPILDKLACDADLVKAWRSGGRMAGLDRFGDRATNAVLLAEAVGGRDLADTVAREMTALAEKARRQRPGSIAAIRQLLETLPVDAEFFEAPSEDESD